MKKIIAAVLLVNLSGAAGASGIERLRSAGLVPVTLEAIKAGGQDLPKVRLAVNKGVNVTVNNTSVNNGSSSVNTNVDIHGSAVNSPGNSATNVAVNNTVTGNGASSVNTDVNVHNTDTNSQGNDNVNIGVNNNGSHNGTSTVNTNIDVHNANSYSHGVNNIGITVNNNSDSNDVSQANTDINTVNTANGEFVDDNVSVNVGNHDSNNGVSGSDTDVTVNGVNANTGKEGEYKSPVAYRYRSQAQKAMEKALGNMKDMRNVQLLSVAIRQESGYGFSFSIKYRSTMVLRTYASREHYSFPELAQAAMNAKLADFQNQKKQIVSAELSRSVYGYSYVIAYFSAK